MPRWTASNYLCSTMTRLPVHEIATAPEGARQSAEKVLAANGFIPNLINVLANAPEALDPYLRVGQINAKSAWKARAREVVQITAARICGCDFCIAGHTKIGLHQAKVTRAQLLVLQAVEGCGDTSLDAVREFTEAIVATGGAVSDAQLEYSYASVYARRALDVSLGVDLATLCNFANNLARSPVDPQLQPYLPKSFRPAKELRGQHAR
ncbi:carboxymuconolactone decarboxylase family protein [Variovorax sp. UC122_21]